VRRIAGYSKPDWLRFQVCTVYAVFDPASCSLIPVQRITYAKAKALVAEHEGTCQSWTGVSSQRQKALLDETNIELLANVLFSIGEEVQLGILSPIRVSARRGEMREHSSVIT